MEFECTEKPFKLCRVHVHVYDHLKQFDHCFLTIRLNLLFSGMSLLHGSADFH